MLIRVAIVEDNARVRGSLEILIGGSPGFEMVGAFANAESALNQLPKIQPHVVLMDILLPEQSGIECIRIIKPDLPRTQIIILSMFEDEERVFEAIRAGAEGYLIKNTPPAEILEGIQEVHRGGSPMSSTIARMVLAHYRADHRQLPTEPTSILPHLTPREDEIVQLLVKGYRCKEVADELSISIHTVREHLRRIYQKLQVTTTREAVVEYLRPGSADSGGRRDYSQ